MTPLEWIFWLTMGWWCNMALERHIIEKDGRVKTLWGEGSVVEAAIKRELTELEDVNIALVQEIETLKASNRVLSKARDENAEKIGALRTLCFEYEDQVLAMDERIRHLEARVSFEIRKREPSDPAGPNGTVLSRVKRPTSDYSLGGSSASDLTTWNRTGEHELVTDVFRVVPGTEIE